MTILAALERARDRVIELRVVQQYRVFGWWYRWQACKCAAVAMGTLRDDDSPGLRAWSYTVFFEQYMLHGAEGTREDFGPKEPVNLRAHQS